MNFIFVKAYKYVVYAMGVVFMHGCDNYEASKSINEIIANEGATESSLVDSIHFGDVMTSEILEENESNYMSDTTFDLMEDFEVLSADKWIDNSKGTDDLSCQDWNFTSDNIRNIIPRMKNISGPEWHHMFGHYPCNLSATIKQKSKIYEFVINAGSWLSIRSSDTILYYGSFDEENDTFFVDGAWDNRDHF